MPRWLKPTLVLLLLAAPALAQAPQQKLNTTLKALESSRSSKVQLQRELDKARDALQKLQRRSTELARKLQGSEYRTSKEETSLAEIDAKLRRKEKELSTRHSEYARTVVSLLRMRQLPATALFSKPDDVHHLMRSASVLQNTNEAVAQRAANLKTELARISDLRRSVAKSRDKVAKEQSLLLKDREALRRELEQRQALQHKLDRDLAAAEGRVRALSRESASLAELIGKLERDAGKPAFGPSRAATILPSGDMRSAKGRLRLPVVGKLLHRFGERKNHNETYRGLVLSARPGGTVVAPYAGEVVFTGPFMDYGRMVLLKHKDGYISLLAGLGSISVTLNQTVGAGEPLGAMTQVPAPSLYVELRERSKPVDPAGWFANLGPRIAQR